jgi:hypothetical protein
MNLDEGMEMARALVEAQYPGRWQELTMGEHRAVAIVGSSTICVLSPTASAPREPFLGLVCGLATEFWLDAKAYELVNDLNTESFFGSFHVAMGERGRGSVVARLLVPLDPVDWNIPSTTHWAARVINTVVAGAERASPGLVSALGGQHFAPSAATALWMM